MSLHMEEGQNCISDAGWGILLGILFYKAVSAGRKVIEVDPYNTSQICSECGSKVPKKFSERWHKCPACGYSAHRDVNAARNILTPTGNIELWEARKLLPPQIALIGGIEPTVFLNSSVDELRSYAGRLLEKMAGSRFVLANSDSCPPGVSLEKFMQLGKMVQ